MGKQKRSENTYQKINTIFMRDAKNVIMPYGPFVKPEFEYLRGLKWRGDEKIDGTNIRIEVKSRIEYQVDTVNNIEYEETNIPVGVHFDVRIAGKTDNAQIPKNLLKHMQDKYPNEKVLAALGLKAFIPIEEWETEHNWLTVEQIPAMYTIYGEGYGEGIQSGGWYIKGGNEFIVFDVKVNNIYLKTDARDDIATKLGAPIVPFIGYFTLDEASDYVRKGFRSQIAENPDAKMAEGLVLRTDLGLRDRMGERLIVKVKYEDFQKYRAVYGTDDKVDQPKNEHY
ncbi:MAG: hypothetical protein J6W71_08160, partial [Methanobrevibacter sp.]|nr:hypothetical protein [Methanobrevibacter sp.]